MAAKSPDMAMIPTMIFSVIGYAPEPPAPCAMQFAAAWAQEAAPGEQPVECGLGCLSRVACRRGANQRLEMLVADRRGQTAEGHP